MNWFHSVLIEHSAIQALIVLSVIVAIGLGLGKLKFCGISLGITWVFFVGILAGHFGLSIDPQMLNYAESFGLVLFVYELGIKVGPGFFSSFRQGGVLLNLLGLGLVLLGTAIAIGLVYCFNIPMSDMVGILSGATTNTPALGAAQQALVQMGLSANGAALSCAVTYPLGVVGVILGIIFVRNLFVHKNDINHEEPDTANQTYIASYRLQNPGLDGLSIQEVAKLIHQRFVISRLWRHGKVTIPTSETVLSKGDRLLIVTTENEAEALAVLIGEKDKTDWNSDEIDWNAIDSSLVSKQIIISKPSLNGKKLGALRLRNSYGINISRVIRSGVVLLADPNLRLQIGDRLTVVGEAKAVENVEKILGNAIDAIREPNMAALFIGIVLGLLLGSIPFYIPGISTPVRLGLAGGPIIVGILIGRFGPQFHLVIFTTRSANLMLRGIGLSLYLGCLGLAAGAHFLDTILQADGLLWIGVGFIITIVPVIIMSLVSMRLNGLDFSSSCGMVCGAMANPMALDYANSTLPGDKASVSYATVYPLAIFSRIIIAQLLVLIFV